MRELIVDVGGPEVVKAYLSILGRTLSSLRERGDEWVSFVAFGRRKELPDDQARYFVAMLVQHGYIEADGDVANEDTNYRITDKGRQAVPAPVPETFVCKRCFLKFATKKAAKACEKDHATKHSEGGDGFVRGPQNFRTDFHPIRGMDAARPGRRLRWKDDWPDSE